MKLSASFFNFPLSSKQQVLNFRLVSRAPRSFIITWQRGIKNRCTSLLFSRERDRSFNFRSGRRFEAIVLIEFPFAAREAFPPWKFLLAFHLFTSRNLVLITTVSCCSVYTILYQRKYFTPRVVCIRIRKHIQIRDATGSVLSSWTFSCREMKCRPIIQRKLKWSKSY